MARRGWDELPASVRWAVQDCAGPVERVEPVATGAVSDLVAVLHTASGVHFCKGVEAGNPRGWMHRNEARLNRHLRAVTPALRWAIECDGWTMLGFEHVRGRHPDLTPGSADLPQVAAAHSVMAHALTPCPPMRVQAATARWEGHLDPAVVEGDSLVHTDATPRNILVRATGVTVVDWASPCRGAAWIDTALMVIRLIAAGHTPAAAQCWAAAVPAWTAAPPDKLDAFAAATAVLTREWKADRDQPFARAATAWHRHRAGAP
ncbi:hypothetical protein AB0J83_01605 [Actinoplanes sp. NPDC049596]|uniref:hypothetical protein n=1 Tax=unclassified Actinoplanes TaxID=2626549 RepID=UPI003449EAC4